MEVLFSKQSWAGSLAGQEYLKWGVVSLCLLCLTVLERGVTRRIHAKQGDDERLMEPFNHPCGKHKLFSCEETASRYFLLNVGYGRVCGSVCYCVLPFCFVKLLCLNRSIVLPWEPCCSIVLTQKLANERTPSLHSPNCGKLLFHLNWPAECLSSATSSRTGFVSCWFWCWCMKENQTKPNL